MVTSDDMKDAIIDDVKSGALAVINKALEEVIQARPNWENWTTEERAKYFLILDVEKEILRRVSRTLNKKRRKK